MKKVVIIDGKMRLFHRIPNEWQTETGKILNFNKLSSKKLQKYGWYDIADPHDFDPRLHERGQLRFDEDEKKYIYERIDKVFRNIDDLKSEKIAVLKKMAFDRLKETDWYCTRKAELGTKIPDDIIANRKEIRDKVVERETEINALKHQIDVIEYAVRIFDSKIPPDLQ